MSFDRRLDHVCEHVVVDEFLYVQSDRLSAAPLRPIASAGSVVVRLNGAVDVPYTGVQTQAQVVGSREGPFQVTSSNNLLAIKVNEDPVTTVAIPSTSRIAPDRLADLLTRSFPGLVFFVNQNRIGVRTSMTGRDSTFRVLSSSTMAGLLGFTVDRVFRGKDVVPGWSLVTPFNVLGDRPKRYVVFDSALPANDNFVEVSYATIREECRRCGGIGVENDWRYLVDGNVSEVRDEELLLQELVKITYTTRQSNPFHSWYGTNIVERIGSKNSLSGVLQNAITSDVYSTFNRWQSIKRQQEEQVGQEVTDREYPFRMVSVQLEQSQQDPTVIFINIEIQNRSLRPVRITRGLRLPEPTSLLQDTTAEGVARKILQG